VAQVVKCLILDLSSGLDLRVKNKFKPCIGLHTRHGDYLKKKRKKERKKKEILLLLKLT